MAEQYIKLKMIGKGTFGQAFLVKRKDSGKRYVVKEVSVDSMTQKDRTQALTEVTALSKCKHLNVIRYKEAFVTSPGQLNIVMEYASAGDLQQRIDEQKGVLFCEQLIIDWFIQICFALKYIHELNILHRDLKAQNIFLSGCNIVKVGDFGISKVLKNTRDHASTAVGTPYYLSPEICQRQPYPFQGIMRTLEIWCGGSDVCRRQILTYEDVSQYELGYNYKSDMWSLGCVLYELCTLKHPFEADSFGALVVKILQGDIKALPNHFSQLLGDLVTVLLRGDPACRPSTQQLLCIPSLKTHVQTYLQTASVVRSQCGTPSPCRQPTRNPPCLDKENITKNIQKMEVSTLTNPDHSCRTRDTLALVSRRSPLMPRNKQVLDIVNGHPVKDSQAADKIAQKLCTPEEYRRKMSRDDSDVEEGINQMRSGKTLASGSPRSGKTLVSGSPRSGKTLVSGTPLVNKCLMREVVCKKNMAGSTVYDDLTNEFSQQGEHIAQNNDQGDKRIQEYSSPVGDFNTVYFKAERARTNPYDEHDNKIPGRKGKTYTVHKCNEIKAAYSPQTGLESPSSTQGCSQREVNRYLYITCLQDITVAVEMLRAFLEGRLGSVTFSTAHQQMATSLHRHASFSVVEAAMPDDFSDYFPLMLRLVQLEKCHDLPVKDD